MVLLVLFALTGCSGILTDFEERLTKSESRQIYMANYLLYAGESNANTKQATARFTIYKHGDKKLTEMYILPKQASFGRGSSPGVQFNIYDIDETRTVCAIKKTELKRDVACTDGNSPNLGCFPISSQVYLEGLDIRKLGYGRISYIGEKKLVRFTCDKYLFVPDNTMLERMLKSGGSGIKTIKMEVCFDVESGLIAETVMRIDFKNSAEKDEIMKWELTEVKDKVPDSVFEVPDVELI